MFKADREAANEAAVRQFFAAWDPAWRWALLVGLRDLRANVTRLGKLMADAAPPEASWGDDSYVFGPGISGLTATAINELAQHCEDLFALLAFLSDANFAQRMLSYKAGAVTNFGLRLAAANDETIRRLYMVPVPQVVTAGLSGADESTRAVGEGDSAVTRLGDLTRKVVAWYSEFAPFHVAYKHGLKLAMRPYGAPTAEAIEERRHSVDGNLIAFTNESIEQMMTRPPGQQGLIMPLGPATQPHVTDLISERALLHYRQAPPVNFDDLVEMSATVAQLLRIAAANRIAVAEGLQEGAYRFQLPGDEPFLVMTVVLALPTAPTLQQFRTY